jgi:hypothetical protein
MSLQISQKVEHFFSISEQLLASPQELCSMEDSLLFKWRAVVSTVMKLRVPKKDETFLLIICGAIFFSKETILRSQLNGGLL